MQTSIHKKKMSLKPAPAVKRMLKWAVLAGIAAGSAGSLAAEPLLWRVNTEPPSWLFGTMHTDHAEVSKLPPAVWEALDSSRSFHPEIAFSPENLGVMAAAMFDFAGPDISDRLPPDLWERVKREAAKLGINEMLLQKIPLPLAPLLFANPPGTNLQRVIDVQLFTRATEKELKVAALETPAEQLKVFLGMPEEQSIEFLRQALDEWEKGFPSKQKLLDLYKAGDAAEIMRFVRDEFREANLEDLEESFLYERNEIMARRALPHLRKGGAFVAVGAAHLPGERGLIELLAKEGLEIERAR